MKANLKKTLSLLLAFTMCLSLVQFSAFAYDGEDQDEPAAVAETLDAAEDAQDVAEEAAAPEEVEAVEAVEAIDEPDETEAVEEEPAEAAEESEEVIEEPEETVEAAEEAAKVAEEAGFTEVAGALDETAALEGTISDTDVAKIGDVGYATLAAAVTAATAGNTITLLQDISLTATQTINKALTIDLNGKNITATSASALLINPKSADVIITGTGKISTDKYFGINISKSPSITINSGVTVESTDSESSAIHLGGSGASLTTYGTISASNIGIDHYLSSGTVIVGGGSVQGIKTLGTLTVNSGAVTSSGSGSAAIAVYNSAKVTVNGGEVTGSDHAFAIAANGNTSPSNYTVNINGGTVSSDDVAIYHCNSGTVNVTDGMITGKTAVYQKCGTLNITGGSLHGTGAQADYSYNNNGANATGDALVIDNCGYPGGAPVVSISGGKFKSTNGLPIASYAYGTDSNGDARVAVEPTYPEGETLVGPDSEGFYTVGVAKTYVAEVNGTKYETLAAAFAAAQDGDTITVLSDCFGDGIKAPQGKFKTKGLTVDFANHTYTVSGVTVGSSGTETIGFQLLKDNKITFKNGTITGSSRTNSTLLRIFQNYSEFTLDGMTVSLEGQYNNQIVMSNCNSNVVIKDSTVNAPDFTWAGIDDPASVGGAAFCVGTFSSYPSVTVTVTGSSVINGDIKFDASTDVPNSLALDNGTINGKLIISDGAATLMTSNPEKVSITKAADVELAAPAGYKWDAEGKLVAKTYVAEVNGVKHETLAEAIEAAQDGETVTLLSDASIDYMKGYKTYTLNLGGHNLTAGFVDVDGGDVTITNGTVTGNGYFMYIYSTDNTEVAAGSYAKLTIENDVTVNGDLVMWGTYGNDSKAYGAKLDIKGTVNGIVFMSGNATEGNNIIEVSGTITNDDVGIALNGHATLNVMGTASITGSTGVEVRAGVMNVTDGALIVGTAVPTEVTANGNGTTSSGAGIAVSQHTTRLPISVNISGGTVNGYTAFYESNPQNNSAADLEKIALSITGGTFTATNEGQLAVYSADCTGFITGGTFSVKPEGYIATGYDATLTGDVYVVALLFAGYDEAGADAAVEAALAETDAAVITPVTGADTSKTYIAYKTEDPNVAGNTIIVKTSVTAQSETNDSAIAEALSDNDLAQDVAKKATGNTIQEENIDLAQVAKLVGATGDAEIKLGMDTEVTAVSGENQVTVSVKPYAMYGKNKQPISNDMLKASGGSKIKVRFALPDDWETVDVTYISDDPDTYPAETYTGSQVAYEAENGVNYAVIYVTHFSDGTLTNTTGSAGVANSSSDNPYGYIKTRQGFLADSYYLEAKLSLRESAFEDGVCKMTAPQFRVTYYGENGETIETYELNAENNWTVLVRVPVYVRYLMEPVKFEILDGDTVEYIRPFYTSGTAPDGELSYSFSFMDYVKSLHDAGTAGVGNLYETLSAFAAQVDAMYNSGRNTNS